MIYADFDTSVHFKNITVLNSFDTYNPNDLQTSCFFSCRLCTEVVIENSNISFSNHVLLDIEEGLSPNLLAISSSTLHNSLIGIRIIKEMGWSGELNINNCSFYALGNYYADIHNINNSANPIFVSSIGGQTMLVTISESKFVYYSTGGLTQFIVNRIPNNATILFKDNLFEVKNYNNTIWYKRISINQNKSFHNDVAGVMEFTISENTDENDMKFMNNLFINTIHPTIPMIYVENKLSEYNLLICLSGNEFYNYAMSIQSVYLSSCFRPKLYRTFLDTEHKQCNDIRYGPLNYEFSQYENVFTVTDPNISVININNSSLALDNALFNISSSIQTNYSIVTVDDTNNFTLIDSFINNPIAGFMYDEMSCTVVCNQIYNRTTNQWVREINQISVLCSNHSHNSKPANYKYVMYSNKTGFSNYLSPIAMMLLTHKQYFAG
eukprot:555565_1